MQMDKINEYLQLAIDKTIFLYKLILAGLIFCLMILGRGTFKTKEGLNGS